MNAFPPLNWRSHDGEYRVKVSRRCIQRMQRLASAHRPNEVGTSLVGYYRPNGHEAVVTSIAPLPEDSRSGSTWFVRGVSGMRFYFLGIQRRFQNRRYRVGEWHSHPDTAPIASGTDDTTQLALCRDPQEQLPEAILMILGGHFERGPKLRVYIYSRKRGRVELLPEPGN